MIRFTHVTLCVLVLTTVVSVDMVLSIGDCLECNGV